MGGKIKIFTKLVPAKISLTNTSAQNSTKFQRSTGKLPLMAIAATLKYFARKHQELIAKLQNASKFVQDTKRTPTNIQVFLHK